MFKILIVEDDTEKLRNITQTLAGIDGINVDSIDHSLDAFGAKKSMRENFYDLLILDISIPQRISEAIDPEGGIKLLHEIIQRTIYKVPTHIIGLTAHETVFQKAVNDFSFQILSVINYSQTDIEWQSKLINGVKQRINSKQIANIPQPIYNYDIGIITALDKELDAVKALSSKWEKVSFPNDASPYWETLFTKNDKSFRVIAACAPQMGMNASAVLSMKLIYNFRPRYLFMTGIAASVKDIETHGYGDVIVINESWDGGAGKITQTKDGENEFLPTANHLKLDSDMAEKIRNIKDNSSLLRQIKDKWKPNASPNTELTVHIGSIATVAGVIENKAVVAELKSKDRKLLGLELEIYGMYYSAFNCSNPKPTPIGIKSISDFANTDKNDMYQAYAAYTSAQVMYEFIMSEL
jgi:nucleoside phosphorylase/CheY-like chemotaxis protein